ncbi:SCP2 sterol-binding domain-containing protein [Suillus subaureus]|uniref:SCP2 sterol-binding domain-containing protein n=1 Tax=Suillus subaureus TaxID=48587 RepID=A0A9P7EHK8_9AGAM|nr:SCP2 sterol-binding domain-containing protein [Suillus subaureus]KAG1821895.1 SCP2 sterol-binding domain-containing protein [Suillus subaureus]
MSDIKVDGFKASDIIVDLHTAFDSFTDAQRQAQVKKTKGIFELRITNDDKKEAVWTIDLKKKGAILKGLASPKADVTLIMSDDTFSQLASGKMDGQKAFLTGKLKAKGNIMLATKLAAVLQMAKDKAKL